MRFPADKVSMLHPARAGLVPYALALAACVSSETRELSTNFGFSALPNIGATAGVSQVLRTAEDREDSFELQATFQPWDDEDIHDDGHPSAGDFTQFQLGAKRAWPADDRRDWTARGGVVWFRAEGEPNIVQDPGDYLGVYAGLGFETHLSEGLTMGPDLTLMLVALERSSDLDVVPQLAWRVTFRF